jgi:lipopolysaccharide export system permease protein
VLIIERYIIRETAKPLLLGVTLLAVIFASYSSALYLSHAVVGLLPPDTIGYLIVLKTVISFEVLLPTALYISVVFTLGRLYRDSEMVALRAFGVSELHVLRTVFVLSVLVAVPVGALSLWVHPWAYRMGYLAEARAQAEIDIDKLPASRFYELPQTDGVLFAEQVNRKRNRLERVFLQRDRGTYVGLILARQAHFPPVGQAHSPTVVFTDGYAYDLDRRGQRDVVLRFKTLNLYLTEEPTHVGYKRKAQPTLRLTGSTKPEDIAELQWRLSTPLATILLGLVAVPLSRLHKRQSRHKMILGAVLFYAVYFNLGGMAKTWVEEGWVGAMPGLWWIHLLPLALLLALLARPAWTWRRRGSVRRKRPRPT